MIATALRDELKLINKIYLTDMKEVRSEALHNILSLADKITAGGGYVDVHMHPEFITIDISTNEHQPLSPVTNKAGSNFLESAADLVDALEVLEKAFDAGTEDDIKILFDKEGSVC